MRKKLSLLVALAISLSISTTSLAAEAVSNINPTNVSINASVLTLEQVLNGIENSNIELQALNKKIDGLNKKYDDDKRKALSLEASNKGESQYKNGQYASIMLQQKVVPVQDEQNISDAKNTKDERFNSIKFELERQYTNAVTAKSQIDNINKNIVDIDEQIKQTQAKISLGQTTADALNPLEVQRSQLLSQIASPSIQMQQSLLNVKKYLNIDSTKELSLAPAKKEFVKFDDTDIDNKINAAVKMDYSLNSLGKNIDIQKTQVDIQTKYAYDSLIEPANSLLTLQDLQNKQVDTSTNLQVYLWKAYYNLKNKEDAVQTQLINRESAQMSYNKAKQSFDNGMIDKVTLDSAELALNNQQVMVQQTINDYMITQEQFQYILNGHAALAASVK